MDLFAAGSDRRFMRHRRRVHAGWQVTQMDGYFSKECLYISRRVTFVHGRAGLCKMPSKAARGTDRLISKHHFKSKRMTKVKARARLKESHSSLRWRLSCLKYSGVHEAPARRCNHVASKRIGSADVLGSGHSIALRTRCTSHHLYGRCFHE